MQILVLYSTEEGHTKKIATALSSAFEDMGNEVFLTKTFDPGYCDPGTFDAAVLCAPIHMGQYPSDFVTYIENWKSALSSVPSTLVTSSLFINCKGEKEQEEAKAYPTELASKTGWKPDYIYNVAGALNYPEYDFFKRWIMKRAAKQEGLPMDTDINHELTDWEELRAFAEEIIQNIKKNSA